MLKKNLWLIYRKWMIIALLSGCVYVFGYSDRVESGSAAAPCIQECDSNLNECNDYCDYYCDETSDQQACDSCLQACTQAHFQCLTYAVSCQDLDVVPGRCSVEYADHCPIINGTPNCSHSGAYAAYYLICNNAIGPGQCVSCPYANYFCVGSNGLAACFGS